MTVENPGRGSNNVHYLCVWWKYHPCRVTLGLNQFSALVDLTLHLGKAKCGNIVDLTLTVKHQQSDPLDGLSASHCFLLLGVTQHSPPLPPPPLPASPAS